MILYELAILGDFSTEERGRLEGALTSLLSPYSLDLHAQVAIYDGTNISNRNGKLAFAATYFRGVGHPDEKVAQSLIKANAIVIPVVGEGGTFDTDLPVCLQSTNGYRIDYVKDPGMIRLASALLEGLGLLRKQRRVFVSYRRIESRAAAVQLHNELSENGFDVFLDTHDIQPGDQFQEMLWHYLCDSDVMVMLDTATYFERKWTREELGRARATGIHVLQLVWPNHSRSAQTDLAETIFLEEHDLAGADGPIIDGTINQIVQHVEKLRSRSVAARMMSMVGKLKVDVEAIGGEIGAIGVHRSLPITLPSGRRIFAYPMVGVPTADLLNDVADKAESSGQGTDAVLVYDHVGLRPAWIRHMKWLDDNLDVVKAIRVREAAWELAGF